MICLWTVSYTHLDVYKRQVHKLDGIKNHSKVSFCVIDQDHVVPHEYTTYFASVIVFGKAKIMENDEEKRRAIETRALRYHPTDTKEHREEMIQREYGIMTMVEVDIEHKMCIRDSPYTGRGVSRSNVTGSPWSSQNGKWTYTENGQMITGQWAELEWNGAKSWYYLDVYKRQSQLYGTSSCSFGRIP